MPNNSWTTADIPDLSGKVMIVTGANVGLGFETAKEFARKGAQTIMACRNMQKAQAAMANIQAEIPDARIEVMRLDLASQKSIHQFADEFKAKYDRLDVLANNAGIMWTEYSKTEDGFESQFGTNHLGHFALTGLLMDRLLATPGARVVNVSSVGHRNGVMDFDNLMFEGGNGYSRTELMAVPNWPTCSSPTSYSANSRLPAPTPSPLPLIRADQILNSAGTCGIAGS